MQQWQKIRALAASGCSGRQIARTLGLSRNTVKRALEQETPPRYERLSPQASSLEPFRTQIETGRRRGKTGVRLHYEIEKAGYTGSRATFYRFLETVDAEQQPSPSTCIRFETDPGEQSQFDWSPYRLLFGEVTTPVIVYSLIFAYSRRVHFFPSRAENQEAVHEALDASFQHFGGACRSLVVDNAKVFVLSHTAEKVVYNDAFLRLCGHYSLQPIASTPLHPQGKGKVENPFGNLEDHLIKGGEWRDFDHFQNDLAAFEVEWNQRVHHTTKEVPLVRFEREPLLPLPSTPGLYLPQMLRTVSNDGLISFGGVRYYVPNALVHQQVQVRSPQGRFVEVWSLPGERLIRHALQPKGSPPVFAPLDPSLRSPRSSVSLPSLLDRFRSRYGPVTDQAERFLSGLLARHESHPAPALERVLDLLAALPLPLAAALLGEAVNFGLCSPPFIEELLRRHARNVVPPVPSLNDPLTVSPSSWPICDVERPLALYGRALPTE